MNIEKFEDIIAWQRARELTKLVNCNFGNLRDSNFRDQICSASLSVMNNIAEGFERKSNNELKQFLFYAKGSCGEVRSMLYVALDLLYISKDRFMLLMELCLETSRLISGFIKSLNSPK